MRITLHLSLLLTLSLLAFTSSAKLEWGLCNQTPTTHEQGTLNITKLMGIWYEYLGTEDSKEGSTYDCASWLMMQTLHNDTTFSIIWNSLDLKTNDT